VDRVSRRNLAVTLLTCEILARSGSGGAGPFVVFAVLGAQ
jgi:hypothetical protein